MRTREPRHLLCPISPSAPDDYTSLATTVVFAAGITEQMVDISIVDDAVLEQPQTFSLELSALTSGVVVDEAATATIVIEDNDS